MSKAMTKGVFHPAETPSERAIKRRRVPDVKRNAPIQSTSEARGKLAVLTLLWGSFGITKIAAIPTRKEAPAMTKKTTFQFANCEIMPP
jgi:hypothetical protein